MKTGIIIPCYNEGKRIDSQAFLNFVNSQEDYYLCFINDGSKDNTLEVLEKMEAAEPKKISVINLKKNGGKAAAVRRGTRKLYLKQDIDYIGFMDADLSTDFRDFMKLVETMNKNKNLSLVYGSRSGQDNQIERNPLRAFCSKIIKSMVSLILGLPIEDTQCGAKVFRRNIVPVAYKEAFLSRWLFDVEIFIRLKRHFGLKHIMTNISEQSLDRWVHVDDSKLGLKDSIKIPYMLLSIWFSYNVAQPFNKLNFNLSLGSLKDTLRYAE